jgi:hypothetical protein
MFFFKTFIKNIGVKISLFFFTNSNLLSYNIFNLFYKTIISRKTNSKIILDYYKNHFVKLGCADQNLLKNIKNCLEEQNPQNNSSNSFSYSITPNIKDNIFKIINLNLKNHLEDFSDYYKNTVCLVDLGIRRNYPVVKNLNQEFYSNFYHCDAYLFTMFKIFINVDEVSDNHGPLHVINKIHINKFLKKTNYKTRIADFGEEIINNDYIFKNIGKRGDILACNTTEVFHKAGEPADGNYRDMIFLTFAAIADKNIIKEESSVFYIDGFLNEDNSLHKKIAKPESFIDVIKFFLKYFSYSKKYETS